MTEEFNFARIYDNQNDEDELENINPYSPSNNSEMCKYHEPDNLPNDLIKDGILSDNKCMQSYLHLNCRGLSVICILIYFHFIILESVKCSIEILINAAYAVSVNCHNPHSDNCHTFL